MRGHPAPRGRGGIAWPPSQKSCVPIVATHRVEYGQEEERHGKTTRGHGGQHAHPRPCSAVGAFARPARHVLPARRSVQPRLGLGGVLVRRQPHGQRGSRAQGALRGPKGQVPAIAEPIRVQCPARRRRGGALVELEPSETRMVAQGITEETDRQVRPAHHEPSGEPADAELHARAEAPTLPVAVDSRVVRRTLSGAEAPGRDARP